MLYEVITVQGVLEDLGHEGEVRRAFGNGLFQPVAGLAQPFLGSGAFGDVLDAAHDAREGPGGVAVDGSYNFV